MVSELKITNYWHCVALPPMIYQVLPWRWWLFRLLEHKLKVDVMGNSPWRIFWEFQLSCLDCWSENSWYEGHVIPFLPKKFIWTYGFDSMTDTHNEFMLFSHFSDEFIWSKSLIKCFAKHFRSTIQCTTKAVTLN